MYLETSLLPSGTVTHSKLDINDQIKTMVLYVSPDIPCEPQKSSKVQKLIALGTVQNLLYDMAGGDEKFLQKICLPRKQLLQKKPNCPLPFLKNVSASHSLKIAVKK